MRSISHPDHNVVGIALELQQRILAVAGTTTKTAALSGQMIPHSTS